MKLFDTNRLPVSAVAAGTSVLLSVQNQGTPVADKAVVGGPRISVSNALLDFTGRRFEGGVSTLTISGIQAGDTVQIGSKTYTEGVEFAKGASDAAAATALAAAINKPVLEAGPAWHPGPGDMHVAAQISGAGAVTGTVDLETSINGVNWETLGSGGNALFNALSGNPSDYKTASITSKGFVRVKPTALSASTRLEVWAGHK